jgi:hypothetical protein
MCLPNSISLPRRRWIEIETVCISQFNKSVSKCITKRKTLCVCAVLAMNNGYHFSLSLSTNLQFQMATNKNGEHNVGAAAAAAPHRR